LDEQAEPAILVGHSMGGTVLSVVGEALPSKVHTLVYLTAMLVEDGVSLLSLVAKDEGSKVLENLVPSDDETWGTIKPESIAEVFYAQCSDADVEYARARLKPQALGVMNEVINTSEPNWGRVPRVYIECLQDKAISAARQKAMYTALPCREVLTLDTDHSPFFSAPELLADQLLSLAHANPR